MGSSYIFEKPKYLKFLIVLRVFENSAETIFFSKIDKTLKIDKVTFSSSEIVPHE